MFTSAPFPAILLFLLPPRPRRHLEGDSRPSRMATPGLQALDTALKAFVDASRPETTTAAYSALKLHSSAPLHSTHAIFISAQWDSTNPDPLLSWKIEDVDVMELPKLGSLLDLLMGSKQTYVVDGIAVPLSETWSQEGLRRFHGLGGDGFRTMVVFLGQGNGTATARFVPYGLGNGTREEVGDSVWAARTDKNWLRSYRERLALPNKAREGARKVSRAEIAGGLGELVTVCAGLLRFQGFELRSARSDVEDSGLASEVDEPVLGKKELMLTLQIDKLSCKDLKSLGWSEWEHLQHQEAAH